jgi:hypothetical protein
MDLDNLSELPILLHMWEDLEHLKRGHASKRIRQYNNLYKKLQTEEKGTHSKVWAKINVTTLKMRKLCRIAFETFAKRLPHKQVEDCVVFQRKFDPDNFKDFTVKLYTRFISEISKENTLMFFTETGGSFFDPSVSIRNDIRFPDKLVYGFPSNYDLPVLSIEVDQDAYVQISKLEFHTLSKGLGMSITKTQLYYAKAPEVIEYQSVHQWLPTSVVTYAKPVLNVLQERKKHIQSF